MEKTAKQRATQVPPAGNDMFDLNDKSVLVTGGTGSFGRAFVSTLLERYKLRRLIVFSRDEQKQFDMMHDPLYRDRDELRFFIGDVRDVDRLEMAMRDVDYVVHAAALKHVPTAEYNPFECIRTNVHGAENIVTAALRTDVQRVVALSTDKAVNPINLYGASKLAADKIFIAAHALSAGKGAVFSVVRYGNVVGSRGSVIPFFQRLAAQGESSLPITDPRMTRFWITLRQGVDFVLDALSTMRGQEIFVPKIPSMKITDLANCLAPDTPTHIVGVRPGEKIHEVLVPQEEARNTLDLGDLFVTLPQTAKAEREYYRARGAEPLPETFRYSSEGNDDWLGQDDLHAMVFEQLGSAPSDHSLQKVQG